MNNTIKSISDFEEYLNSRPLILCYFSYDDCSVCKVVKPKVIHLIQDEFPKVEFLYINTQNSSEISGQCQVFTVPTILFYVDGKEQFRLGRNFGIPELSYRIERIYNLRIGK